ncbi:MAG: hypothetical protein QHH19_04130 [Candidatus Thermoplasmatota archaeon]|jgi:hypothetical protein|nr:hypothetical protein [Candidatus Thermoplasmatota archaeon]
MIEVLESILPYIKGLWTLPWILVGFIVTLLLSHFFEEEKINKIMKKIGLILLYFFVPLLLFKIFLGVDFHENEIIFTGICFIVLSMTYAIAYLYSRYKADKLKLKDEEKKHFLKTALTNQGRSSAFVGGALLAISSWRTPAAIYMSIGAIFLFAIIPYILSHLHKKDTKKTGGYSKVHALPWYLRIFPWYLLVFAFAAITLHALVGVTPKSFGYSASTIFDFFTSLTIPAALYYVGSGIHIRDLKKDELKKLFGLEKYTSENHWAWVRNIFFLTVVITPIIVVLIFSPMLCLDIIPNEWFVVIVINSILPITSTNMFLVPYGIDKKTTAHSVTWTTIVCVPIVVLLIYVFSMYLV